MLIRNIKSKWEGEVDEEGWERIKAAGWEKKYKVLDKRPMGTPTELPAELKDWTPPAGNKQKLNQSKLETDKQGAGSGKKTPDENMQKS